MGFGRFGSLNMAELSQEGGETGVSLPISKPINNDGRDHNDHVDHIAVVPCTFMPCACRGGFFL